MTDHRTIEEWSHVLVNLGSGETFGKSLNDVLRAFAEEIVEQCWNSISNKVPAGRTLRLWHDGDQREDQYIRTDQIALALEAVKKEIADG